MNVSLALGVFLLGAGVGGLLVRIQEASMRRRLVASMTDDIDEALFGNLRRERKAGIAVLPIMTDSAPGADLGLTVHGKCEYPQAFD
jgi:hypothetical protein